MKHAFIPWLVFFSVLSGCSKVVEQPGRAGDDDAWKYDESLPVPIVFSAGPEVDIESKTLDETGIRVYNLEDEVVGVFALAAECDDNGTPSDASDDKYSPAWSARYTESSDGSSVLTGDGILFSNSRSEPISGDEITFDPVRYYPMDNSRTYSFYSYYPHHSVYFEDGWLKADYDLGMEDILYADVCHAKPFQDQKYGWLYGFNSLYVRSVENSGKTGEYRPELHYKHKLVSFAFEAEFETVNYSILQFWLPYAPAKVSLRIAGTSDVDPDNSLAGSFEIRSDEPDAFGLHLAKPKEDGNGADWALNIMPETGKPVLVGNLLAYIENGDEKVDACIQLKHTEKQYTTIADIVLTPPEGGFIAGRIYSYKLEIKDDTTVKAMPVSLDEWKDGFDSIKP